MARRAWLLLLVAPMVFAGLSGCVDCVSGPPVSARGIDSGDATAGVRGFSLDIRVTDGPGGAPLGGAGVVAYYSDVDTGEWSGPRVEVGPDRVIVEPLNVSGTVEAKDVLRMRTSADGVATARVPGNRIVGVVVAAPGFTEEWVPALASGDTGSSGSVTVPLFRQNMTVDIDGVWGPGAASTGKVTQSQYQWDPREVPFGESEDANRGYAARIVELQVAVAWTNAPQQGAGDLGIGVGPLDDNPSYYDDGGDNVALGEQSEQTLIPLDRLREHGILGAPTIHAGAATDTGFLAPFGMPYTMRVDARFDTARAAFASCFGTGGTNDSDGLGAGVPGPGVVAGILALAGAAALTGRLGRRSRLP